MIDKVKTRLTWVRPADFFAGLTLLFTSILFFYDIFADKFLFTERDLGPYFIPPRFFWVESIKQWDFPLWNPLQFCGYPFLANPQHGILYPFNGLFFILPFDWAFNAVIILHFFLGGLFTYLLLRDLRVCATGALISGLIFMLGGYLLSLHNLLSWLLSVVWTPLIMLFFKRALTNPGFKNEIFVAIFMAISFFGGGVEVVYGNFIVLLFMVIFSPLPDPHPFSVENQDESILMRIRPGVRSLFIVSIVFLFVSAIQLFPFLELIKHSIRGKGVSYEEATIWSFAPKDILLFVLPDAYGYFLDMKKYWVQQCWLKTLYTGGLSIILGSFFFLFSRDRKLYFLLMLLSLFLAMGKYNPLYFLVHGYVPFFDGIRYPVKFLYIFILSFSVIAGLGFQRLTELVKENDKKRFKNLLIAFSLVSGFLLLFLVLNNNGVSLFLKLRGIDSPDFNHLSINLFHAKRFLFYLTLFFLLIIVGNEVKWKGWIKGLLIFFLAADLFGNMGFYGREKTLDYFQKTKILEMIQADKGDFRIFSTAKTIATDSTVLMAGATSLDFLKEKHLPSMNMLHKLPDIWGIDVIRLKRSDALYNAFTGSSSPSTTNLIDLYGVRYVVSITPFEEDPRLELIYSRLEGLEGKEEDLLKDNTIKLYKNPNALPRGWLVEDYRVLDSNEILSTLIDKAFDPRREVLLEKRPKWEERSINPTHADMPGSISQNKVEFIHETNNQVHLRVNTTENQLLVLSDTYFPGWKVFVDGKEKEIYRADYSFRAVPLGAGTHVVEFVYDPASFKVGAVVTFLGIMGCLILGSSRIRGALLPKSKGMRDDSAG